MHMHMQQHIHSCAVSVCASALSAVLKTAPDVTIHVPTAVTSASIIYYLYSCGCSLPVTGGFLSTNMLQMSLTSTQGCKEQLAEIWLREELPNIGPINGAATLTPHGMALSFICRQA